MDKFKKFIAGIPAPITEAIKEGFRVLVLGIVSWLLTGGVDAILNITIGTKVDPATRLYVSGLLTTGLRAVDKWLHEQGKINEAGSGEVSKMTAGIVRF